MSCPVGKRIKIARRALKLSQKALGIAAGFGATSSSRINHYENARHQPDYETLKKIAKVLNLPVAYFYADGELLAKWIVAYSISKFFPSDNSSSKIN